MAQPPIYTYMRDVLRFPMEVAQALVREGINNFELEATTDDEIVALVKNIRRPGGFLPPERDAQGAVIPGQAPVANHGVHVTERQCLHLRQLAYYCFHMHRIDRPFVQADATVAILQRLWEMRSIERQKMKDEFPEPEPLTKQGDTRKFLDSLDHYLLNKRGINGTPLAYLVRADVVPPAPDPQPYGVPTLTHELIRRARHGNYYAYEVDNETLWSLVRRLTANGFAWGWISMYSRTQNGRGAYLNLKTHYLGSSFQDRIQSDADRVLETTFYDGKARNFTFENYCTKLNQAFSDLEECGDRLQEHRKIRIFLRGLRAPELNAAKHQVIASEHLQTTVATAMNFVKTIENTQDSQKTPARNVSAFDSGGRGRGRGDRGGRGGRGGRGRGHGRGRGGRSAYDPQKKHYAPAEWSSLSEDEKQKVRDARVAAKSGAKRNVASISVEDQGDSNIASNRQKTDIGVGATMTRRSSLN